MRRRPNTYAPPVKSGLMRPGKGCDQMSLEKRYRARRIKRTKRKRGSGLLYPSRWPIWKQ